MNFYIKQIIVILIFSFIPFISSSQDMKEGGAVSEMDIVQENYERNLDSLIQGHFFEKVSKNKHVTAAGKRNPVKDSMWGREVSQLSDTVFIKRLSRIPTTIPLQYNAKVRNLIEYYLKVTLKRGDVFFALSNYYSPLFEEILDAKGVPLEFKYLPVVESALNPNAVSRAGAVGLWQFMYATGKMYGLNVNSLVDERKDPIKSSAAAADYLMDLYKIFGNWTLAIAAYNCGPGNVNKAIRRAGGSNNDFWTIYEFLPKETRGYVPAFIAVNYVMHYHQEHGINPSAALTPVLTDTVMVNENIHFKQIAFMMPAVSVEQLRELNPQYKSDIIPGKINASSLKLPITEISAFIASYDSIINFESDLHFKPIDIRSRQAYEIVYHKVRKGDTWSVIAAKYNVSVIEIKQWNNTRANSPQLGKQYIIHRKNSLYKAENKAVSTQKETIAGQAEQSVPAQRVTPQGNGQRTAAFQSGRKHTVKKGESLYAIATKYNVNVEDLKAMNNLKSNMIKPGQVLKVSRQ